jgi:hypothetical protein
MGLIDWLFGFNAAKGNDEDLTLSNQWQRDQAERGGTRAASTLRNENQAGIQNRLDTIHEREPTTWKGEGDRRSGDDRRGLW